MDNNENMSSKDMENKKLILIPKIEDYIEYMLNVIIKLPRVEKFSIGNEYKTSMYSMLENSLYTAKINRKENIKETLKLLNKIDAELNCQRIFLRILKKQKWIDEKKFDVAMIKIYEIGKIVGGIIEANAKNYKERI